MMSGSDENVVLSDLTKAPPQWMMYSVWSRQDFLSRFPGGVGKSERFPRIEGWVEAHYEVVQPVVNLSGYKLMRRKADAATASLRDSPLAHPASQ
jgi:hypothetical protein